MSGRGEALATALTIPKIPCHGAVPSAYLAGSVRPGRIQRSRRSASDQRVSLSAPALAAAVKGYIDEHNLEAKSFHCTTKATDVLPVWCARAVLSGSAPAV